MSTRAVGLRLALTLAACASLAACAIGPTKPTRQPAQIFAHPAPPPTTVTPLSSTLALGPPWSGIVASFVLHDCGDAPLIHARETMFARHPISFTRLLKQALPLMVYVHAQLQAAGIPGEFVMLPLLESGYQPGERSRHRDAAGMWQFMPRTARSLGIKVIRHYDGRRDPIASTRAAIDMLKSLFRRFGDWRLVDMAYNAGPYAILGMLHKHPKLGGSALPELPAKTSTRNHLAKLMALSCILRDPARFHVQLPKPAADDALATVKVPARTRLRTLAEMAEIPDTRLRALNPGYTGKAVPSASPRELLLPRPHADALLAALAVKTSEAVAQVNKPATSSGREPPLPAEPAPPADTGPAPHHVRSHRVRKGESLWSIAHHFHVSVHDLKSWNHLHGDVLHPGEVLRIRR